MIDSIYVYLTDFTITMSNLMGITYEDFNALIFCVIWPLLTLFLFVRLLYVYLSKEITRQSSHRK